MEENIGCFHVRLQDKSVALARALYWYGFKAQLSHQLEAVCSLKQPFRIFTLLYFL